MWCCVTRVETSPNPCLIAYHAVEHYSCKIFIESNRSFSFCTLIKTYQRHHTKVDVSHAWSNTEFIMFCILALGNRAHHKPSTSTLHAPLTVISNDPLMFFDRSSNVTLTILPSLLDCVEMIGWVLQGWIQFWWSLCTVPCHKRGRVSGKTYCGHYRARHL